MICSIYWSLYRKGRSPSLLPLNKRNIPEIARKIEKLNLYHRNSIYLQRLARRHITLLLALNFTWHTIIIQHGRNSYVARIANCLQRIEPFRKWNLIKSKSNNVEKENLWTIEFYFCVLSNSLAYSWFICLQCSNTFRRCIIHSLQALPRQYHSFIKKMKERRFYVR